MADEPYELWPDPRDGLIGEDDDDFPQTWDEVGRIDGGPTDNPILRPKKYRRWYVTYHKPRCTNVKISVDRDPDSGWYFDPHPSSGQ